MSNVRRRKKKESLGLKIMGWVFMSIEIIAIMILTFTLIRFPILPAKYWVLYGVVCAVVLAISAFLLIKQTTFLRYFAGVLFSLVMATGFVLGFFYLEKTRGTLDNIIIDNNQPQTYINQMAIMVRENDDVASLSHIIDDTFGIQKVDGYQQAEEMISFLNDRFRTSINVTTYDGYTELGEALINGDIRAIILEKSYVEIMEEYEPGFAEKTRILEELEFTSVSHESTGDDNDNNNDNNTPTLAPEKDDNNSFRIYMSGIDTYGGINLKSRSDVNIIMTVNPTTKKILLVTTSRDAYVEIPGITKGSKDKLTHAGIYGVEKSVATLEQLYGVNIDYFLRVNFTSIEKFVDLVGGIDINVPQSFTSLHTQYYYPKGMMHMDGKHALEFIRERYSFEDGDNQRARNQMEFIKVIVNKMINPSMLTKFSAIMDAVQGNFQTNMSMDYITSLVRMQLNDGASWDIETYSIENKGRMDYCYSYKGSKLYVAILNEDSVRTASEKMRAVYEGR